MALAVPTLTLTDNADDTGCVCAVTGSTAGSTNTLFSSPWSGGFIPAAFTSAGSRVGDGNVTLALAAGYYWVYCRSTKAGEDGVASLVYGVRVTTGALSIYEQCLDSVLATLQALSLSGISSANIVRRKVAWERRITLPGIIVTPPADTNGPATNGQNDFAYDVLLTIAQASNEDLTANLSRHLLWRQIITGTFLPVAGQAALAGVSAVHDVEVIHGPVVDGGSFKIGEDVQQLTVRCISRRNRGLL